MMEAISWKFKIPATTFHIYSTRPMTQYFPPPLGISTTACHVASSTSLPSLKAALTRETTISYFFISTGVFSILSFIYTPPPSL